MSSRIAQREQRRAEREAQEQASLAQQRRRRRMWLLLGGAGVAVAILAIAIAVSQSGSKKSTSAKGPVDGAATINALFAGIPQRGTAVGDPKAPLTLQEFADAQCPFCAQYATDVMPEIVKRYVRTGKVRMVFQPLAFIGEDSVRGARAALAAGDQGKLWTFLDLIYHNQGAENSGYMTDAILRRLGAAIPGLDVARMLGARNAPTVDQALSTANTQASGFGIDSTPSFVLGPTGKPGVELTVNQLTVDELTGPIDAALKKVG